MASGGCCSGGEDTGEVIFLVCYSREKGKMKIVSVSGCPYEDHEGGVLNLNVELEAGEMLCEGGNISIEMWMVLFWRERLRSLIRKEPVIMPWFRIKQNSGNDRAGH